MGKAVGQSGIPRDEVFITTKLWNDDHGYDSTLRACRDSLKRLGDSRIDLYLIHWPVPDLRDDTWRAMTSLLREGKCRAIGVSNYTIRHLEELLSNSDVVPAVNQVEFSPFLYQNELLEYCKKHKIQLEAYSPLTRGERLADPRLVSIAKKYRRTPAQILIRWSLLHGVVVIPKSVRPERIRENSQVFDFELGSADMHALDSVNENLHTSWDPTGMA